MLLCVTATVRRSGRSCTSKLLLGKSKQTVTNFQIHCDSRSLQTQDRQSRCWERFHGAPEGIYSYAD